MSNNAELTQENKELKNQVKKLEEQLTADTVAKSEYDKVKTELDALNLQLKSVSFPTLKADLEAAQAKNQALVNERDQARKEVMEAAAKVRELERTQRVDEAPRVKEDCPVSSDQLLILAALCLPFARTESGRPMTEADLSHNGPGFSHAAVQLAKGLIREIM